jgi:F420H(2)-dependent biliverdin reductase
VPYDLADLGTGPLEFLAERHLATLTTLRADGSPHVVPVGVTFDAATLTARVITSGGSAKAHHRKAPRAPQPSHARAGTLHRGHGGGHCLVERFPVERYARRYRQPRVNPARVVLEIAVDRILGNA